MYISFLVNACCCCFFFVTEEELGHSLKAPKEKKTDAETGVKIENQGITDWWLHLSRKNPYLHDGRHVSLTPAPPSTWNSKTAWASSHIRISIAFNPPPPPPPVGFSSIPSVVGMWIFSGITEWSFSYSWILTNSPSQSPSFGDQYTLLTRCILWSCLVRESRLKKECPAFHFCIHSSSVNEHC